MDFGIHRGGDKLLERQWSCAEHKRRFPCRVHQRDDGAQGINRATARDLKVHFYRVSVVLFIEHSLNVKLLCDLAIKGSPSRKGQTGLILHRPCIAVCIGTNNYNKLLVVSWIRYGEGHNVVKHERLLIHALHGACLSRTGVLFNLSPTLST